MEFALQFKQQNATDILYSPVWYNPKVKIGNQSIFYNKFYQKGSRLQLIRSVWRASKFSVLKIDRNCNIVGLLHHPFWLQLILAPFGHYFSNFEITLFG